MDALRHVYWIGGGSGAGKTTVAARLAAKHGLRVYSCDEVMPDHARRSQAQQCPLLHQFMAMDLDQRWVHRSPREMLETFHWFHGEAFSMVVDDLRNLPAEPPILVEGFRLLPALVQPLLTQVHQAVWLLPSPGFRERVFHSRGGKQWSFLARTSEPERALRNLLQRDALFTQQLAEQTRRLGLRALSVDSGVELVPQLEAWFQLGPSSPS